MKHTNPRNTTWVCVFVKMPLKPVGRGWYSSSGGVGRLSSCEEEECAGEGRGCEMGECFGSVVTRSAMAGSPACAELDLSPSAVV